MKKIFILLFCMILLIGIVSAFEFDNIKNVPSDFNFRKDTITIKNSFLLLFPLGKVADIKLISHTDQALIEGISIFEVKLYKDYSDPISKVEFYNVNGKEAQIYNYKWEWFDDIPYEIDVNDYEEICINDIKNLTSGKTCTQKLIGTHKETRSWNIWREYNREDFKAGTYKFRLTANKPINTNVDFIPTLFGVKLPEFAWYNSDWKKKKQLNLTATFPNAGNISKLINVTYDSDMLSDFGDIRIVNETETGEVGYWFYNNSCFNNDHCMIWVYVSNMSAGDTTYWLYYDNSNAVTTSNIQKAFWFGDDFNGSLDWNRWQSTDQARYSTDSGMLNCSVIDTATKVIQTVMPFNMSFEIEARMKTFDKDDDNWFVWQDAAVASWSGIGHKIDGTLFMDTAGGGVPGTSGHAAVNDTWYRAIAIFNNSANGYANWTYDNHSLIQTWTGDPYADIEGAFPGFAKQSGDTQANLTIDWIYIKRFTPAAVTVTFGGEEASTAYVAVIQSEPLTNTNETVSPTMNFQCNNTKGSGTIFGNSIVFVYRNDTKALEGSSSKSITGTFNDTIHTLTLTPQFSYDWFCFVNNSDNTKTAHTNNFTLHMYPSVLSVSPTLRNPNDGMNTTNSSLLFGGSAAVSSGNLTNMTAYVWDSDSNLLAKETNIVTGEISNSTNITISNLQINNNNLWNILACADNSSGAVICNFAPSNRTFSIIMKQDDSFFNNHTTEGSLEIFLLNITVPSANSLSTTDLVYNGTAYTSTKTDLGDSKWQLKNELTIPTITTQTNFSFFWNVTLDNGFEFNTQYFNQSVIQLGLDNCSSYSILILNYTLMDEETLKLVNGTIEVNVQLSSVGIFNPLSNFSTSFTDMNPSSQICIANKTLNNTEFRMDTTTKYESTDGVVEYHHIQNFSLNNRTIPQNILLYDLNATDSQEFKIIFKDTSFTVVENALIDITRFYIDEGIFRSVEIAKTSSSGQALGHFVLGDVIYTLIVSKEGVVLATFENIAAVCDDVSIGNCIINLNAFASGTLPIDFETESGLSSTLTFDEDTRIVKSIFSTLSGASATINLSAVKFDRLGNETVCSTQLITSSGTIQCEVPESFGNITIIARLSKDDDLVKLSTFSIKEDASEIFGKDGMVFLLVMIIILPLMIISSTIGMIIAAMIGIVFAMLLNFFEGGSFFGVGATFLWLVIAGGIIIWKIAQKEDIG